MIHTLHDFCWECDELGLIFVFDVEYTFRDQSPDTIDTYNGSTPGEGFEISMTYMELKEVRRVSPLQFSTRNAVDWTELHGEAKVLLHSHLWKAAEPDAIEAIRDHIETEVR